MSQATQPKLPLHNSIPLPASSSLSAEGQRLRGSQRFCGVFKKKSKTLIPSSHPVPSGCPRQGPSPFPEDSGKRKFIAQHPAGPRPGQAAHTISWP